MLPSIGKRGASEQAQPARYQEYFSDVQLAARYSVSRATIWRWVSQKRLPEPEHLSPGTTRWRRSAIDKRDAERASGCAANSYGA